MRLFVAATSLEFRGVLKRCTGVTKEPLQVVWARSGFFQSKPALLLANGAGANRAYAAIQAAKERNPSMICSVGFCGALDPKLKIGEIVVTDLVCSDHVVETAREKRALHAAGYAAVDMESAGALRGARELGISYHAVKAVSDLASEDLRCDYNRALRDDGSIDVMSLSLQAVRHPLTCLPDLIRFGRNALHAAECMGEFLAGCEF
jgi:nucleoside phosphorylase